MAFLRWRRAVEIAALDRPWLGRLLLRRRAGERPAPDAAHWDAEYRKGTYDRLLRSEQRHHHRLLAALVAEARPGLSVLEIGCGEGAFYEAIRPFGPARYLGLDISPEAIARANARFGPDIIAGRAEFRVADARDTGTAERFDAVLFPECIEYLGEIGAVVAQHAPLLKRGGCIGVTMWLGAQPVRRWWRLREVAEIRDEAVVSAAWGGAWVVATLVPR
jgi:cyclopropane fatty-acyl-phospholipid synthase-like methyltransferase